MIQNDPVNSESSDSNNTAPAVSKSQMFWHSFKSIILNPVLFMTILGTLGGFVLTDGLPKPLAAVLKVFITCKIQ